MTHDFYHLLLFMVCILFLIRNLPVYIRTPCHFWVISTISCFDHELFRQCVNKLILGVRNINFSWILKRAHRGHLIGFKIREKVLQNEFFGISCWMKWLQDMFEGYKRCSHQVVVESRSFIPIRLVRFDLLRNIFRKTAILSSQRTSRFHTSLLCLYFLATFSMYQILALQC